MRLALASASAFSPSVQFLRVSMSSTHQHCTLDASGSA